ncbi:MAG: hypothetical protein IJX90_02520 [Blautia sp.]|nr:hypothetical protein [Blautia sp.]
MPVGKESIKRAASAGTKKPAAKKAAAPKETKTAVIPAPAEEVVEKVIAPAESVPAGETYGIGDELPFYLW